MKTLVFTLIATVLLLQYGNAQDTGINITGTFSPKDRSAAYISVLGNTNSKDPVIAEVKVTDGVFSMQLPANLPLGVYKLGFAWQEKLTFYFVHDGEERYHIDFKNTNNTWTFNSNTGNEHNYLTKYWQQKDSLMTPIGVLYFFAQNYPHKQEAIYKKNNKALNKKVEYFKHFRAKAIAEAPPYSKEILAHKKTVFYEPQWDTATIEANFLNILWESVPKKDSLFYNKPYVLDKLQATFDALLEDSKKTEAEKYEAVKKRITWLLKKLEDHPNKSKYYNLCIRYFGSKGYPYVFNGIDLYLDQTQLLTPQDAEGFAYRAKQHQLIQQKAPPIATSTTANFLETVKAEQKILVFVAGNTPFSFQLLNTLKEQTASKENTKVIAVLLTDNAESIQNFKSAYPKWELCTLKNEEVNTIAEAYKLVYVPTVYILDKDNTIIELKEPFAPL